MMTESQLKRFTAKINVRGDGCWEWTAHRNPRSGYGMFMRDGRRRPEKQPEYAHRVAYEHFVGEIPDGLFIDHVCGNRECVNPEHLEPVTNLENIQRAVELRTHCRNGHPRTPKNTYVYNGVRTCAECVRSGYHRRKNAADAARWPSLDVDTKDMLDA